MKKEFYDRPLHITSNYITEFFFSSINLAICNILLILFLIFTVISPNNFNLFILFICLIPLGPSLGALYSTIGKIVREKDIYFSSFFWSSYKRNFVSYLKLWLIELITITILFIDFQYFNLHMPEKGIHIIFLSLILISLVIGLYAFPINSRFEIKRFAYTVNVLHDKKIPTYNLKNCCYLINILFSKKHFNCIFDFYA